MMKKMGTLLLAAGCVGVLGQVSLAQLGFAAIGAFFALYFLHRHWSYAGLGLTAFGVGFVLIRVRFGHLPDRIGACLWQSDCSRSRRSAKS